MAVTNKRRAMPTNPSVAKIKTKTKKRRVRFRFWGKGGIGNELAWW